MKAIHFNENGEPSHVATYAIEQDLHDNGGVPVPEEVSDEEIIDTLYQSINGDIKRRIPRPSKYHKWDREAETWWEDVESAVKSAIENVENMSETARIRFITPGFGQMLTYEAKYSEALSGGGPILNEEARALGKSVESVVTSVLEARDRWEKAGARIEAARMAAKKRLREASTASEAHEVVESLDRTLSQM